MKLLAVAALAGTVFLGLTQHADAVPILCTNPPDTISCSGTLDWNDATQTLTIVLTNTGAGDLTAIALNLPDGVTPPPPPNYSVTVTVAPPGSESFVAGLDGMQDFEFGAESTADGLDTDQTGTFTFIFLDPLPTLTTADFVGEGNKTPGSCNTPNNGVQDAWGCVHIQRLGENQEGSAFVQLAAGSTPPPSVPEPHSLLLVGTGILGIGYLRRRMTGK